VAAWVDREVREFRDGVKRELENANSGYNRLRRDLVRLRSKILGDD
jgi:hypothetical protein